MENTEEIVLCAASAYEQKFYLNPDFMTLPESIRQELQIMCVLYTADVGGILIQIFGMWLMENLPFPTYKE